MFPYAKAEPEKNAVRKNFPEKSNPKNGRKGVRLIMNWIDLSVKSLNQNHS